MAQSWRQRAYDMLPTPLQHAVVVAEGWRTYRARFGAPYHRALTELRRTDFATPEEVRAGQERQLAQMVTWAATTVPYYRDLFRKEGIDPASIRSLEDLPRIPILDKETVRARTLDFRSEEIPSRDIIPGHTSGTTGTAMPLFHTREAFGWEYAVIWRQRGWFNIRLGDRFAGFGGQLVVPVSKSSPPFWRYDRARRRMLFSLYHMGVDHLPAYVEALRAGYSFWQGYPSSIGIIADHLLDQGIELGPATPQAIFTSSETLFDFQKTRIANATGALVADRYGNSELAVSALQCPDGNYHVDTEFGVVEIDEHTRGPGWVRGEVIATGFANRAMPFLRYRTGDIATLREGADCPCGRSRPILESIDGRIEDHVVTPDGRRLGRLDHVFKETLQVREAQLYQPARHRLIVRIVPRPGFSARDEQELERELRIRLGRDIQIHYEVVEEIERSANGKFRAVISDVHGARPAAGSPAQA